MVLKSPEICLCCLSGNTEIKISAERCDSLRDAHICYGNQQEICMTQVSTWGRLRCRHEDDSGVDIRMTQVSTWGRLRCRHQDDSGVDMRTGWLRCRHEDDSGVDIRMTQVSTSGWLRCRHEDRWLRCRHNNNNNNNSRISIPPSVVTSEAVNQIPKNSFRKHLIWTIIVIFS